MLLKVPVLEAKNKLGCGPTSLSMVLKYFHKNYSEKQVLKQLKIGLIKDQDRGTLVIDHALLAQKLEFDVVCYSYNMELYKPYFIKLSRSELLTELNTLLRKKQTPVNKKILSATRELIESGANFKIKMPSQKDIINFLKKKLPVILAVNAKILFEKEVLPDFEKLTNSTGHFIVITGFLNDYFYYNDPYDGHCRKIFKDKLFFAWSNNILDSSAYFLALLPK